MSEDVIFIPSIGPLAGIAGNVKRPAIYELKNETKLLQLIDMAGGLTSIAFKGRVQVQRIDNHESRILFEGDLLDMEENEEKNFLVRDGDLVKLFSVIESPSNILLSGAVANEGEYAITAGVTRIKDVILKAGGVLYYSSDHAELARINITQSGPVTEYFDINIKKALNDDPAHNIPLEMNDYLFVRTIPEWGVYETVTIDGEVRFPGTYTIKKNEKLSSLIKRAGGYTDSAYLRGTVFTRVRVKDIQQKSLALMAAKIERELFAESSSKISTAVSKEEIAARETEAKQKKELIETLYKIKATGRMTIKLADLKLLKGSEYDILLEEGDNLFIPKKNSVVNVLGAVMSRGSFIYTGDLDYKDYISLAGGYTNYADKKNIYVLKVDGTAMKLSRGFFNWNDSESRRDIAGFEKIKEIEPGDSIVVSEKFERIAWMREIKDLSQILYQIAVAAAVVIDFL
jgi:protein involved in polysaccharide export with SLBB domain